MFSMICIRWTRYEIICKYIHIDLETHTCIYIYKERQRESKIQIFSNISIYYVVYLECCHGRFCRMSFQTGKATSAISWQWQPTIYQRKATNVWCVPRVTGFHRISPAKCKSDHYFLCKKRSGCEYESITLYKKSHQNWFHEFHLSFICSCISSFSAAEP